MPAHYLDERPVLDDLVVTRGLGTGGYSCVVQGEQGVGSGRIFALKCLDKLKHSRPKDRRRLQNELNILQIVEPSPFLLRSCVAFESLTSIYFVTEALGGGDLFSRASHTDLGTFPETQVRAITAEIVLGLIHLHRKGFIHCDIKVRCRTHYILAHTSLII